MFIYVIRNNVNNKVYVGKTTQTLRRRWNRHLYDRRKYPQRPLYRALHKYGVAAFALEVLEEVQPPSDLDKRERFWINAMRSNEKAFGYNLTEGGGGGDTFTNNPNKENIRAKFLGRKHSAESRLKQSISHSGKAHGPMSEAQKQKIRETNLSRGIRPAVFPHWQGVDHPMYGKTHTKETKQKMSVGQRLAFQEGRKVCTADRRKDLAARWQKAGNPKYLDVDRDALWGFVLSGVKISDMAAQLKVSQHTVMNKIRKEFGKSLNALRGEHHVPVNKRKPKGT